ncbi:MAG: hypothetical protein ACRYHA_26195, partial [Janthinobacterium lividum]
GFNEPFEYRDSTMPSPIRGTGFTPPPSHSSTEERSDAMTSPSATSPSSQSQTPAALAGLARMPGRRLRRQPAIENLNQQRWQGLRAQVMEDARPTMRMGLDRSIMGQMMHPDPSLMPGGRGFPENDQRTDSERATTAHLHQSRPVLGLDDLSAHRSALGRSGGLDVRARARSYRDRLEAIQSHLRRFMNAPGDRGALERFRAEARVVESDVGDDHAAGRIGEGDYIAILDDLSTMFRRVPDED